MHVLSCVWMRPGGSQQLLQLLLRIATICTERRCVCVCVCVRARACVCVHRRAAIYSYNFCGALSRSLNLFHIASTSCRSNSASSASSASSSPFLGTRDQEGGMRRSQTPLCTLASAKDLMFLVLLPFTRRISPPFYSHAYLLCDLLLYLKASGKNGEECLDNAAAAAPPQQQPPLTSLGNVSHVMQ